MIALLLIAVGLQAATVLPPEKLELIEKIAKAHKLDEMKKKSVEAILRSSPSMGQGNLKSTVHPVSREQCLENSQQKNIKFSNPEFENICGAPYMAPIYKSGANPKEATTCIDQFEFPDIPCEYPVVWTSARNAALTCEAMGKRLCDAHEWEGACDGSLEEPDYAFKLVRDEASDSANLSALRRAHNPSRRINWSYGPEYRTDICGTGSSKSPGCDKANETGKGVYEACGPNTYPAGNFPECKSRFGVYDLNGNAAEHMSIPLRTSQMSGRGGMGLTEMKGSWFVFNKSKAHEDDCRWRAPYWHGTPVMDIKSHANYHLSFRCCKSL